MTKIWISRKLDRYVKNFTYPSWVKLLTKADKFPFDESFLKLFDWFATFFVNDWEVVVKEDCCWTTELVLRLFNDGWLL